jgi:hypothetical protein
METTLSNLGDSSFEHVLHSYGLHLVSTYKYEVGSYVFYVLDNHLSSLQLKENNITNLNQCLLLITKNAKQCCIRTLNSSFFFDLH